MAEDELIDPKPIDIEPNLAEKLDQSLSDALEEIDSDQQDES
jgi:hypothetical protein